MRGEINWIAMAKFMVRIKAALKRIYYKVNPQHKQILLIRDVVLDLQRRISVIENRSALQNRGGGKDGWCLDKLFMASEPMVYRYLYLLRYIRENDSVLDVECGYGTGADLLSQYASIDNCLCLNSIDYYTRAGKMYYDSDYVTFRTGTIDDLESKFCIITVLDENKTILLDEADFQKLCGLLEHNGILALAVDADDKDGMPFLTQPEKFGLSIENAFYQNKLDAELTDNCCGKAVRIIYYRKNG